MSHSSSQSGRHSRAKHALSKRAVGNAPQQLSQAKAHLFSLPGPPRNPFAAIPRKVAGRQRVIPFLLLWLSAQGDLRRCLAQAKPSRNTQPALENTA